MFEPRLQEKPARHLTLAKRKIAAYFEAAGVEKKRARHYANMTVALLDGMSLQLFTLDNGAELRKTWTVFVEMVV
jgi:hypothetical protein